ncbi:hypothetical protein HYV30_02185 [Candidatus Kaiserbacteria bacterium]|nr:hypothetical protein [Candidatus Kaiserbacteria bacterium]
MITDADAEKLEQRFEQKFATKDWALANLATKKEMYIIRDELKEDISEVKELVQKTLNAVDGFTGKVADLDQESKFGAAVLHRHDVQIHELAAATGTKITE